MAALYLKSLLPTIRNKLDSNIFKRPKNLRIGKEKITYILKILLQRRKKG